MTSMSTSTIVIARPPKRAAVAKTPRPSTDKLPPVVSAPRAREPAFDLAAIGTAADRFFQRLAAAAKSEDS
jgi:hypothetical protein